MPVATIQRRIPWPRGRPWRPGEPLTLTDEGMATTYLLRGVMQESDPSIHYATVTLEPIRTMSLDIEQADQVAS
jgi:hypothetical protein